MYLECTDDDGFGDQLTKGKWYKGYLEGGSVSISNDNNEVRWYGLAKFRAADSENTKQELQS